MPIKSIIELSQNLYHIIIGLFGIGFLIGFHELGHFLFCKLFYIRTPSFSIGFGPKILSKKIGETEFSLSAIPLGGYVEIAGSAEIGQGEQKHAYARDQYSFAIKPYYQKLLVLCGGIVFNMLFAYCAFILLFSLGLPSSKFLYPKNALPVIQSIQENSAAYHAGLQEGDTIVSINDIPIEQNVEKLFTLIQPLAHQTATFNIKRNNEIIPFTITLDAREIPQYSLTPIGSLGVIFKIESKPGLSISDAIIHGIQLTNEYIYKTIIGFVSIFKKKDIKQLAGPLMIISITVQGAAEGIKIFLIFLAFISINLAILNLLPLPILDGGQIMFHTIEALIGKQIPEKIKEYIGLASWIMILILTIYLTAQDIRRIAVIQKYILEPLQKFFWP